MPGLASLTQLVVQLAIDPVACGVDQALFDCIAYAALGFIQMAAVAETAMPHVSSKVRHEPRELLCPHMVQAKLLKPW